MTVVVMRYQLSFQDPAPLGSTPNVERIVINEQIKTSPYKQFQPVFGNVPVPISQS